jgi:hypothetical protein
VLTLGGMLCLVGAALALWLVREHEIEREPLEAVGEPEREAVPQAAAA